jgi:hypothetical protein
MIDNPDDPILRYAPSQIAELHYGLTEDQMRDVFALVVLHGCASHSGLASDGEAAWLASQYAGFAYATADAMMKARGK